MADGLQTPVQPANLGGPVRLRLRLLGRMEAWTVASEPVLPRVRKTRALLALLALSSPNPSPRARLAALLWSTRDNDQARGSLRQALHELTVALAPCGPPLLMATRDEVLLVPDSLWVDALEAVRQGAHPAAAAMLDAPLLEDMDGLDPAFDRWLNEERRRFRERARIVAEHLLRAATATEDRLAAARRLIAIDASHEEAWRGVISAHAERGERRQALEAFDACRAALASSLRAALSAETEALGKAIRAGGGDPLLGVTTPEAGRAAPPPVQAATLRRPARGVRLGVAPLSIIGSESAGHLSLALAEEITTALARLRWIAVVSSASFAGATSGTEVNQRDAPRDPNAIGRMLELDFVLSGSVQQVGTQIRVTLRLADLREGGQVVWAQRYDRDLSDLLVLQDEIAAAVVASIDPEILLIEANRAMQRPAASSTAYDLLLRAIPAIYRLDRERFGEAGRLLLAAIQQDPDYAAAHAWAAYWNIFLWGQGWAEDPDAAMRQAESLAERAVSLDPSDARALTIAGHVRAFLHRQFNQAISLHDRALTLNPNLATAWVFSGAAHCYAGNHVEAIRRIERYRVLSPMDPHAFLFETGLMAPNLFLGRHQLVVEIGRKVTAMQPRLSAAWKPYLAALGHLGAGSEAMAARIRLLDLEPGATIASVLDKAPYGLDADRVLFAEGLAKAGLRAG